MKKLLLTFLFCMIGLSGVAKEISFENAQKILTKGEVVVSNYDKKEQNFDVVVKHKGKLYFCWAGLKFSFEGIATKFPYMSAQCFDSDKGN